MQYRKFGNTYVLRLMPGEDVYQSILDFATQQGITLGHFTGLGAVDYVKMGLFDIHTKVYNSVELREQLEITSLVGNISQMDGKTYLHTHINVGDAHMKVMGGHLNAATVSATAEIFITVVNGVVDRSFDSQIGINVLDFDKVVTEL